MLTDHLNREPLFASQAQEVFTPGDLVYERAQLPGLLPGPTGTYLGHRNEAPVVDFGVHGGVRHSDFAALRQLYR